MGRLEDLLIGRHVAERYRVDALLGRGGMGVVYRATDERLDRPVALKVLSPPCGTDAGTHNLRARFRREARAAAAIRHPNVVGIHDYGVDSALDLDYLVMELLAGEDLASFLSRAERPGLDTVLAVLAETAAALAAGHARGIVHRDVKPANIFLAEEDGGTRQVRLLDFGIAQAWRDDAETMTRLTQFGQTPLTPAFAAPEQAAGRGELTPAADVYGLGMTALAMLSDGAPHNRMLDGDHTPIRLAGSPTERQLEAVLSRALDPDPTRRFANGGELAAAIAPLRSRSPSAAPAATGRMDAIPRSATRVAPPPPAVVPPRRSLRMRRRRGASTVGRIVAYAGGTAVTGAALFSAWTYWPTPADPASAGPESVIDAFQEPAPPPPPTRPWPSLVPAEERHIADRRSAGMSEREALLRLAVEQRIGCEFGGSADACARAEEIEAYLLERGMVHAPSALEQDALAKEGSRRVQEIQDLRISMSIVRPSLYVETDAAFHPTRVFLWNGEPRKAVADIRWDTPVFETQRVVEEFYFDGGQLVHVRRRSWASGAEPVVTESFYLVGGVLASASSNGAPIPLRSPGVQLNALLLQRRGEAIYHGARAGETTIPVSLEDLHPRAE